MSQLGLSEEPNAGSSETRVAVSWSLLKLDAEHKGAHYPLCLFVYFDIFQNKRFKKKW